MRSARETGSVQRLRRSSPGGGPHSGGPRAGRPSRTRGEASAASDHLSYGSGRSAPAHSDLAPHGIATIALPWRGREQGRPTGRVRPTGENHRASRESPEDARRSWEGKVVYTASSINGPGISSPSTLRLPADPVETAQRRDRGLHRGLDVPLPRRPSCGHGRASSTDPSMTASRPDPPAATCEFPCAI